MAQSIVLIDDDLTTIRLLRAALESQGYVVVPFLSGEAALDQLKDIHPAAVILDIVMPGLDGLAVLRAIRAQSRFSNLPVILLTSRDSEVETVLGLELGADDYLAKPVRYHELVARLRKVIAKSSSQPASARKLLELNGLTIDRDAYETRIHGQLIALTHLEFELVSLLAANAGKVFTRDQLLEQLWHEEQNYETRTVDVHIRRLRKKFEENGLPPHLIETVRNVGYRFSTQGMA